MTRSQKIARQLKELRTECICQDNDPILRDVAYAMEQAVRYATEDGIRGWESLSEQAKDHAKRLRSVAVAKAS